jgi:transposase
MPTLYLGVDVSKGYVDCCFLNEVGSVLPGSGRFDDTPAGHAALQQQLDQLTARSPQTTWQIGLESTGGLERNWVRFFQEGSPGRLYRLNPLVVKQFLARELHRNRTDPHSARGIAQYLREGLRAGASLAPTLEEEGPRLLYRLVRQTLQRQTQVKNQLQSLLPTVHPDLVPYARRELSAWLLRLLEAYPTSAALAQAAPAAVARIPYLTLSRANTLVAAAQASVAALRDPATGLVVATLAQEVRHLAQQIDTLKQQLRQRFAADPTVLLLTSLPGVGVWTAVCLRLEYGLFTRFHSAAAVVAFAGLDPLQDQSGDGQRQRGISHRGRRQIRAVLWMAVQAALQQETPLRPFYQQLRGRGKSHGQAMTACMAKLLRWAYAVVVSGQPFQSGPARAASADPAAAPPAGAGSEPAPTTDRPREADRGADPAHGSWQAPVSRREERRRRAAAVPQVGQAQRERGPGAARPAHASSAAAPCQDPSPPLRP